MNVLDELKLDTPDAPHVSFSGICWFLRPKFLKMDLYCLLLIAFIKPFEALQRSVKIKFKLIFFPRPGSGRESVRS